MTSPETDTGDLSQEGADTPPTEDVQAEDVQADKPKLKLDIKVDKPSACERHVTVTIDREDVDRYINESFDELMPKAEVPGFRPGRAPRKLVESRFRKQVGEQVKSSLLMDSMTQVSDECEFSAISEPDFDFDAIDVPDEGAMTFEFDIEVRPEFDLPKWKGMKIEKPVREFAKEDVDRHLQNLLARYGEMTVVDGPAKADGQVEIDVRFRHNGREVSHLHKTTVKVKPILTFHDTAIEGFDKLLEGAKAGDKLSTKAVISHESLDEGLRGEEVDVEIHVVAVKELKLPEIDEDLLSKIGDFENEGELRDAVESEMERQVLYHQQRRVREQITALLIESADWALPPDMLRRQARRELERAVMELQRSGFGVDEIRAHENELRRNSMASTSRALKEHFILERIAEEENIEADDNDYSREIALIAYSQGDSPRRVRARLEKRGQMDALRNQIIERKVIEMITEEADFKEVEFKPREANEEAVDFAVGGEVDENIPEAKHGGSAEELPLPVDHT
ncbi:MAG: trigger factor [Pirellulaceae bacterium]